MAAQANASYGIETRLRKRQILTCILRINVNDPGLITLVNKLQDVFTTVGVREGLRLVQARASSDLRSSRFKTPLTYLKLPSLDHSLAERAQY